MSHAAPGRQDAGLARVAAPPLAQQRVVVIGCGGLGVPAAWTLAAAGVGALTLWDDDRVELSNLHRQTLYREVDVGRAKVDALAAALQRRYPAVRVDRVAARLDSAGAVQAAIAGADAVFEGSDDAASKFATNDAVIAAHRRGAATVAAIAGAVGRRGQLLLVRPGSACLRCAFEEPPAAEAAATCRVAGALGPAVGLVGSLAARALVGALGGEATGSAARAPAAGTATLLHLERRQLRQIRVAPARGCACVDLQTRS